MLRIDAVTLLQFTGQHLGLKERCAVVSSTAVVMLSPNLRFSCHYSVIKTKDLGLN